MATHEPVNFSGSSSNRTAWRRVSSDGGAQLKADNVGGKSPGKTRKFSLFKKTSSKDDLLSGGSGRFERSSGRGKRKTSKGSSSRDSSLDGLSSDNEPRNQVDTEGRMSTAAVPGGVASSSKPPIAKSQARDYAIGDSQELEHRSASELSARKVQKINKELTKQNNQLNKDVDTLRRENEVLQSEKLKLKGENKTLERELRRVSSKGEVQRILKNGPTETDLEEIAAEQRILERGQKIDALKRKLEKQLEYFQQRDAADKLERMEEELLPESEKQSNSGGVWDSKTALKRLVEEQDISSRLQKENLELKSKVAALEADLEQLVKARSSPKNSRIKPGNFFRRSKRGGESQKEKLTPAQASGDSQRARSPDIPLSELLTFDTPSSLEGTPIHKPLPAHLSPNQSPKLEARDRQNSEIQELKSRIRSTEEDKKSTENRNKELETELREVKSQLEALQVKVEMGRKDSEEVDKLKKSLKMANSEKTSLSGQIQHLRKELDEVKTARRSAERSTTESLKKKDGRIEELELDCSRVKKECEKLQRELESSKASIAELKRKDSRIDELEGEYSKARKECERLQKELESAKVAIAEAKNEPKVTTPMSVHTAAKPPSGANRHTSPSHSANTSKPAFSVSKSASATSSPKTASSPVSSTSSPKIASSPVSSTSDSVFVEITESNSNKVTTSDMRKLSSDSSRSASESVSSRVTRKSSAESIGEKKSESQPRSRRNSKSPPRLRKRRSSTELIELFEHPPPKETLKPAETNVKRNTSFANLATSVSHRAKVAATRAMFEGKKDDEPSKTPATATVSLRSESKGGGANRNIYRRTWTGDITQLHRSSHTEPTSTAATIPEGKEAVMLHTKSQSVDSAQHFKSAPSPSPATATTNTSTSSSISINSSPKHTTSAAPSKPASLNLTSSASTKKVGATIVHQHSLSSTPSSAATPSSPSNLTVTPASTPAGSKVSKITIKSSSSPSTSPQLNTRKEVRETNISTSMRAEKVTIPVGGQRSRVISSSSTAATPLKSPTTPLRSPNTPLKTPTTPVSVPTTPVKSSNVSTTDSNKRTSSVMVTSNGVAKTPSYVPSYMRSNTVSGGESVTSTRVKAAPVTRSQTAVKFTVTTTGSTPTAPQPIRTNIVSPQAAQPEHGILKRGSSLLNTSSDLKKTSSLLDIPENVDESNESSSNNRTSHTSAVGNSTPGYTTSSGSSLGVSETPTVMHRSPVQTRIQRRKREDRPKTMYAGANRSETVSLVRLISKYQEQERKEKGQTNTALSAPASTQVPAVNGNASPTPAAAMTFSNSAGSSTISSSNTNVVTSSSRSTPRPRPQSYYGGSSDLIGSGFSTPAAVPAPSNMSSGRKPKKARRSQTVALGGINRTSKKAMLLRWCQIATDHYDNVSIDNFGESFSDGLAFCALLHHFIPDQIPYSKLDACNREQNFRIAFEEAEKVGIPRLLDVEDMVALPIPDWMSVMTYITFVYNKFGKTETSVA